MKGEHIKNVGEILVALIKLRDWMYECADTSEQQAIEYAHIENQLSRLRAVGESVTYVACGNQLDEIIKECVN